MESFFKTFYQLLSRTDISFMRYLYPQIKWGNRLIGITGARGTGKTTLLLQHIKKTFGAVPKDVLYVSLDDIRFSGKRLFDLASDFDMIGGKYLFIDEVHKYSNWSQEIKNIYDSFPDMKVVFTGSSMLEIYKGDADLSRRVVHYVLHGMSFREFLEFDQNIEFEIFTLNDILQNHIEISSTINQKIKPLPLFQQYLRAGYYPYYKEELDTEKILNKIWDNFLMLKETNIIKPSSLFQSHRKEDYFPYYTGEEKFDAEKLLHTYEVLSDGLYVIKKIEKIKKVEEENRSYTQKLLNTVNVILDADLPSFINIEISTIKKIKQLLLIIAQRVPFTPNVTELASILEVSRKNVINYLILLEKAHLLNLLQRDVYRLRDFAKPEKIYLNNTNLAYALENEKPDIGNLRETFFFNQLKATSEVTFTNKADFMVDKKYIFEVGGKNKGHEQIVGLENAFLALDNVEYGFGNKIPLWLFGMLY